MTDYKLIILDLDHTIRKPKSGGTFSNSPDDQVPINQYLYEIHPNSIFVGLVNQGGVIAGHRTLDEVVEESFITLDQQPKLSRIAFCPDWGATLWHICRGGLTYFSESKSGQGYRKPEAEGVNDLMFLHSAQPHEVLMYGDRDEDRLSAQRAGIAFNHTRQ